MRVAQTLAYAHERGVIDCDIKPDNIIVGRHGEAYLLDWGIAKVGGLKATDGNDAATDHRLVLDGAMTTDGADWDEKLARYAELGVAELLRFDPEAPEGERMRAWDRIDEDLVEREVEGDRTPCVTLGWTWVVHPVEGVDAGLRLADANGEVVLTQAEAAKGDTEARVLALEEELRRYRGEL